jgi:hypothetical protein
LLAIRWASSRETAQSKIKNQKSKIEMTESIYRRVRAHFASWREWELNPVVIKELRQSVRSWAVTGMLLLFLAVLFAAALIFLVTQAFEFNMDRSLGEKVFSTFLVILTGASLLFIPTYVGARLAGERQESNLDLLYVTSLTPRRIILGKFLCGAYMAVLFFSICMPFMVFTNLLRGIDLPTILFILACLFIVLCVAIQVAIFLACLPIAKLWKILIALIGLVSVFVITGILVGLMISSMSSGIGSTMGSSDFWITFLTWTAVAVAALLLFYFLSVACITPLSANRALPLRIYITVIWLLSALLSIFWTIKRRDPDFMLPWATTSYILLIMSVVVVISNRDELSLRIQREIPVNLIKRVLAFLFFNGAAGGLVWIGLLAGATYAVTSTIIHWPRVTTSPDQFYGMEMNSAAMVLYAFAYGLTALWIQRQFFSRQSPKWAGFLSLALPCVWAIVPFLAFFILNRLTWRTVESSQLGNVFNVFFVRDPQRLNHVVCGVIWVSIMVLVNARWFVRQIKQFKPPEPVPPVIPAPAAVSTPAEMTR